ncbi:MAG: lysophospholipid acyltransferase family protein [Lacipirellulaceae bacterium]
MPAPPPSPPAPDQPAPLARRRKPTDPLATHRRGALKGAWYWLTSTSIWVAAKLLFRLRVQGARRVPMRGPLVIVANHLSHLDPPLVGGSSARQLSYMARDTLFKGVLGPLIRSYDAIPVDRDGTGLAGIRATLGRVKQGGAVVVFPEGTRSPDGELQAIKPGFLALVRRGGASLQPVGFDGPHKAWPKGAAFPTPFVPIAIHYGEPLSPDTIAALDDERLLAEVARLLGECVAAARELNAHRR